jgi:RuvA N terminal domain
MESYLDPIGAVNYNRILGGLHCCDPHSTPDRPQTRYDKRDDKQPNRVIIEVGGVGYDVHVPLSTFYNVGDEGAVASLRLHTHVREDALKLYDFSHRARAATFERLIAISGIGPKLAIVVRSGMEPRSGSRGSAHGRRTWRRCAFIVGGPAPIRPLSACSTSAIIVSRPRRAIDKTCLKRRS